MKLTNWHNFVVASFPVSRNAKFCQKFVKFRKVPPKFRPTRNEKKDRKLQSYVTSSILWLAPNIILIEKIKKSADLYVSDDPRVYEPVCYEMLVGKGYYAKQRRFLGGVASKVGGSNAA